MNTLPTIDEVLADPSTSYWLRDAVIESGRCDLIDALRDAEILLEVCRARVACLDPNVSYMDRRVAAINAARKPISPN
jgi:hypothetical protein